MLGSIGCTGITSSGSITGTILNGTLGTAAQPNVTSLGPLTSLSTGSITQTSGSTTLLNTTVGSLTTAGNITNTAGNTTVKTITSDTHNISTGNTLSFAGTALVPKINLYGANYALGVSSNQLNIVNPTTAALVVYGGGTNNDGVERLRVSSTGTTVTGNLTVTGNIIQDGPLSTSANTGTNTVSLSNIPSHQTLRVTLTEVGLSGNNSVILRVGQTAASSALIYSYTTWQKWSASQSVTQGKNVGGIYLSGALNNNEGLYGTLTFDKVGSGTSTQYVMSGILKATNWDETVQYTISAFIKTGWEIGNVTLVQSGSANFNRTGALIQATTL